MKTHLKIFLISLLISIWGVFTIYSTRYPFNLSGQMPFFLRQIIWIIVSLFILWLVYNWDVRKLWDLAYLIYIITLALLLMVAILGHIRLGAQRWLKILWLNFQPSELAKLSTIIILARYFSSRSIWDIKTKNFNFVKGVIFPLLLISPFIILILAQPDLGTALILIFIYISMLYLSKIKKSYILILIIIFLCSLPFAWHFLRDYQKERLLVFLKPGMDPLGAGYTVTQSKIAIGSGRLLGKGWLAGTQSQLRFLPESHTDFIFSSFAEEWGLLGSLALLGLYYLLINYFLWISQRSDESFLRLLAGGIVFLFSIQIFINLAMNLGMAPVVGIPLIFFSYGGSSIFISFICLGIMMNIQRRIS